MLTARCAADSNYKSDRTLPLKWPTMAYAIRTDRYRAIFNVRYDTQKFEPLWSPDYLVSQQLYDYFEDAHETENRATNSSYAPLMRRLSEQLQAGLRNGAPAVKAVKSDDAAGVRPLRTGFYFTDLSSGEVHGALLARVEEIAPLTWRRYQGNPTGIAPGVVLGHGTAGWDAGGQEGTSCLQVRGTVYCYTSECSTALLRFCLTDRFRQQNSTDGHSGGFVAGGGPEFTGMRDLDPIGTQREQ